MTTTRSSKTPRDEHRACDLTLGVPRHEEPCARACATCPPALTSLDFACDSGSVPSKHPRSDARPLSELSAGEGVGFFQVGGDIAGDFPICVFPSIEYDLAQSVKPRAYLCLIGDSPRRTGRTQPRPRTRARLGRPDRDNAHVRHRGGRHDRHSADPAGAPRVPGNPPAAPPAFASSEIVMVSSASATTCPADSSTAGESVRPAAALAG